MKSRSYNKILLPTIIAIAATAPLRAGDMVDAKLSPACKIALSTTEQEARCAKGEKPKCFSAFITVSGDFDAASLDRLGVSIGIRAGNIVTARIPFAAVEPVSALPGVEYIEASTEALPMLDLARKEAGLPYEAQPTEGQALPITGKGVIVGIIDRGFDYTHEAFRDEEGNCRIVRVWEQAGTSETSTAPENFGYGIELSTAADIAAAEGDVQGNSHGTHVAGIAAGSSPYRDGLYYGTAPESEIVLVSMDAADGDNTRLADAMAYIFGYAEEAGKPCVINLSLGSQIGPHDGTSPFDKIADSLSGEGRLLVGSAGNHGNDKFHVSRTFTSADDAPLATFIDFKNAVNKANAGGIIDIWGDQGMRYRVELICYSKGKGAVTDVLPIDMEANEATEYNFAGNVTGPLTAAVETNPNNGKLHVMIKSGITSLRSRYFAGVRIMPQEAGKVDIWADNNKLGLTAHEVDGYAEPGREYPTIAEIGGTATSILTVGAYTTRAEYTVAGGSEVSYIGQVLNDICTFSSYGPTSDGRQKPEITAPGCFIIASVSAHDNSGTQILADYNEDGGHRYGYMQGTSMSSPFVAGVVAGWLQIDPRLDPVRLKEIVAQTARRDERTDAGNAFCWGAGKINPRAGVSHLLTNGITDTSTDSNAMPLLWPGEIIFPASCHAEIIVSDMAGRIISSTSADVSAGESVPFTRDTLQILPGMYLVSVRTEAGQATAKVVF